MNLNIAIKAMTMEIVSILEKASPTVYLYGSCATGDFKLGWSDIDILVLTEQRISSQQAEQLVSLRQTMLAPEPDNLYYHSFEGGILSLDAFINSTTDRVVYWGTSGQRITDRYVFNAFSMNELLDNGILLYGKEVRDRFSKPPYSDLETNVQVHYAAIRNYAKKTRRDIYAYGWLLDISRCIYTLRTGKIAPKTYAGEWALEKGICPVPDALVKALLVRKSPLEYRNDSKFLDYAETLGPIIQQYADVLETALEKV